MDTELCWTQQGACAKKHCPQYINFNEARNCSLRLTRTLTKAETARAIGVSRARIGQLEDAALTKIRAFFGISAKEECVLTDSEDLTSQFQSSHVNVESVLTMDELATLDEW